MNETAHTGGTIEVQPKEGGHSGQQAGVGLNVSLWMMLLTWVVFISMTIFLYKIAWKPILAVLAKREATIKKSLDDAEKARQDLVGVQAKTKQILAEAEARSREMMHNAKASAGELAVAIENKAKQEARQMITDAQREISSVTEKARASLRRESAELAIGLAGKILEEKLDPDKNMVLVDKYMKEV